MKRFACFFGLLLLLAGTLCCGAAAVDMGDPSAPPDSAPLSGESGTPLPSDTGTTGGTGDLRDGTLGDVRDGDGVVDVPSEEGTDTAMTSSEMTERDGWGVFGVILAIVIAASVLVLVIALLPRKRGDM